MDLNEWADRLPARSELPRIIYRLIHETVEQIDSLSFPCAEDTQLPGWDGRVEVPVGNQYVPAGISRWEVKVSQNSTTEANRDYEKRTANPGDVDPTESTFVFATLRRWSGKDSWVQEKRDEGKWKEVRAYDAADLAAWLSLAPATLTWLSTSLGKQPRGVRDLENEWLGWSEITNPPISIELVLAGREETAHKVQAWLSGSNSHLSLQADSQEDAFAVFAASALSLHLEKREHVLARTVVVSEVGAWDQLIGTRSPLILLSRLNDSCAVARARRYGHRVFVPLGATESAPKDALCTRRLSRRQASEALRAMGLDGDMAWRMASLARRGLKAFQRRFAVAAGDRKPSWAVDDDALALCPLILAGAWQAENKEDRAAIELLSDKAYDDVEHVLRKWSNHSDPPVRFVEGLWVTTSIEDSYSLLKSVMPARVVSALRDVAIEVLGTVERKFIMPKGERFLAEFKGMAPTFSQSLRKGLADTLALAATRWDDEVGPGGWQSCAGKVVSSLLSLANADWLRWASISDLLPLLAEAAPSEFLSAAEAGLNPTVENPTLLRLFEEDQDSPIFASSPHTGLLWALETLAWSPQHLSRTTLLLGGLACRDPGGKLANRPSASLRGIFLPWRPCTTATIEERLGALDLLRAREPDVSWKLLFSILPEHHSVGEFNARPRWRDWSVDSERPIMEAEYLRLISEFVDRMLIDAQYAGGRWADLSSRIDDLPPELHELVLDKLSKLQHADLTDECRAQVWHALRRQVSRHRSFQHAEWALPTDRVDKLAEVSNRFEPESVFERYGWLFDHRPALPEGREGDYEAYEKAVEEHRLIAVRAFLAHSGISGLAEFAERAPQPQFVGIALGLDDAFNSERNEQEVLERYLASNSKALATLVSGFGWARVRAKGSDWVKRHLDSDAGKRWSPQKRAALLMSLSCEGSTFEYISKLNPEDDEAYWSMVNPWYIANAEDAERAVGKLIEARRAGAACRILSFLSRDVLSAVRPGFIAEALEGLLAGDPDTVAGNHDTESLLRVLVESEAFDRNRVAWIEWALLPAIDHKSPKVLHNLLATDPGFFVSVVCWMCGRMEGDAVDSPAEKLISRAHLLLRSWRQVPGTQADNSIDATVLKEWTVAVRADLRAKQLLPFGDEMIGQLFSGSPVGVDSAWPHEAVRDLIEEHMSDDLEEGLMIGKFNSRGVVWCSPEGGGEDERSLSIEYQRHATIVRKGPWPRTAAMLDRMAARQRDSARYMDRRSELEQDLG
jgi:hypothetical protein